MLSLKGQCERGFNHVRFKYETPYSRPLTDDMVVQINRIYSEPAKSEYAVSIHTGTKGILNFQRTLRNISESEDIITGYDVLLRLAQFHKENLKKLGRLVKPEQYPIVTISDVSTNDDQYQVQIALPPTSRITIKSINLIRVLGLSKCVYETGELSHYSRLIMGREDTGFIHTNHTTETVYITGEPIRKDASVGGLIVQARAKRQEQVRAKQQAAVDAQPAEGKQQAAADAQPAESPTEPPVETPPPPALDDDDAPEEAEEGSIDHGPGSDDFKSAEEDEGEEEEEEAAPPPPAEPPQPVDPPKKPAATGRPSTRPPPPKKTATTVPSAKPGIKRPSTGPPTEPAKKLKPASGTMSRRRLDIDDSFVDNGNVLSSDSQRVDLSYDNIASSEEFIGSDEVKRYRRSPEDEGDYEAIDDPVIMLIHSPLKLQYSDLELVLRGGDSVADIARKLSALIDSTDAVIKVAFTTKDNNKLIVNPPVILSSPPTDLPGYNLEPYYIIELDPELCDLLGFSRCPLTFNSERKRPIESSPIAPLQLEENALDAFGHFYAINDQVTLNEPSTLSYLHQLGTRQVLFSTKKHRAIPFRLSTKRSDFELVLFKDIQAPLIFPRNITLYAELHILNYL